MVLFSKTNGFRLWMLAALLYSCAAQKGYISIDCGATMNYTDAATGIEWTTDAGFVGTGTNKIVSSEAPLLDDFNKRQLQTLRYFPIDRKKHCYNLPAVSNSSYLIRHAYLQGDFVGSSSSYSFQVSVDSTLAEIIKIGEEKDTAIIFEYVVAATADVISFCLLPSDGEPILSSLELRPLDRGMYDTVFSDTYMKKLYGYNCGAAAATDPIVRYPDDPYDRMWIPYFSTEVKRAATTAVVPLPDYIFDKPPTKVMQTAWVDEFTLTLQADNLQETTTFYITLFIAEIESVTSVRAMRVTLNDDINWINMVNVTKETNGLFNKNQNLPTGIAKFAFNAETYSKLPPILNALEMFAVIRTTTAKTNMRDAAAVEVLKGSLGLQDWNGDPCLPVAYDWITCGAGQSPRIVKINLSNMNLAGSIPAGISVLTALTDLVMANNQLRGPIPDLSALKSLEILHLENNTLSGSIPDSLSTLPLLTELFLQNNKLSGPIPASLENRNGLKFETAGNVDLCPALGNCAVKEPEGTNGTGKEKSSGISGAVIGAAIGGVVVVLIILGLLLFCICKRRRSRKDPPPAATTAAPGYTGSYAAGGPVAPSGKSMGSAQSSGSAAQHGNQGRSFSLAQIQQATQGYKTKIGEGGFGPVYYGKLPDDTEVAVKVNSANSGQGTTEFLNEVSLLSRVHHKNLVSLLGYCEEDGQQILIYEFMAKGTLREHIYGKDRKGTLTWLQRLDVALNAAQGLEYLHNDCVPKIIHRDVKSNNILLNEKIMAKVADFGISKSAGEDDQTNGVSTVVRGTTGYLDPEYYAHNRLTQKSDVYSFGVVLLETICGRAPNNPNYADPTEYNLVEWARRQLMAGDINVIVDTAIAGSYNAEAMWKVVELAMGCVEPHSVNRPDMKQVVRGLTEASEFEGLRKATAPSMGVGVANRQPKLDDLFTGSYPSTQSSVTSPTDKSSSTDLEHGQNPRLSPLYTPPGTFYRVPSDNRSTDPSWMAPTAR